MSLQVVSVDIWFVWSTVPSLAYSSTSSLLSSPMWVFIQVSLTSLVRAARSFRASWVSFTVWALQVLDFRACRAACESEKNLMYSPHVSSFTVKCLAASWIAISYAWNIVNVQLTKKGEGNLSVWEPKFGGFTWGWGAWRVPSGISERP